MYTFHALLAELAAAVFELDAEVAELAAAFL